MRAIPSFDSCTTVMASKSRSLHPQPAGHDRIGAQLLVEGAEHPRQRLDVRQHERGGLLISWPRRRQHPDRGQFLGLQRRTSLSRSSVTSRT
jgi:hypothetical protein